MKPDPPVLAALERLSDEVLLADLTSAQAELKRVYAEFREMVDYRRMVTVILTGRGMTQRAVTAHLGISAAAVAAYMKSAR